MIPAEPLPGLALPLAAVLRAYPTLGRYLGRFVYQQSPPTAAAGRGSEFYQPGESWNPTPGKPFIEAFGPQPLKPKDLAGEIISHYLARGVDPALTGFYNQFRRSITPTQTQTLHQQYQWARKNEGETRPYQVAARTSLIPAYFRGYAFQQWPNAQRYYTPDQIALFNAMTAYLRR